MSGRNATPRTGAPGARTATASTPVACSPQQLHLAARIGDPHRPRVARAVVEVDAPGGLDLAALERAAADLAARHEILRTAFETGPGGEVAARVHPPRPVPVADETGSGERSLAEIAGRSASAVDPRRGAGLALTLLDGPGGRTRLLVEVATLAAGARSLDLLLAELADRYAARSARGAGTEEIERDLLPYDVVAEFLDELLEAQGAAARRFWKDRSIAGHLHPELPGAPSSTGSSAASDEDRGEARGFHRHRLAPESASRLATAGRSLGVPEEAILLCAWQTLLAGLTGDPSVVVGVTFDGRGDEELADAVGPLARSLPLAPEGSPAESFADRLGRQRDETAVLGPWQELFSWGHLADVPEDERYFSYGFTALPAAETWCPAGATLRPLVRQAWPDRADLALTVQPVTAPAGGEGDGWWLDLAWDQAVHGVSRARMARLARSLEALLDRALARPEAPVTSLDPRPPAERHWAEVELNDTALRRDGEPDLARRVARQAERTPERIALTAGGRSLSYGELERRVSFLARHLRHRQGITPEDRVALGFDRSPEMVVALLAVLRAGACFVPVDPGYPRARRDVMLDDAGAACILLRSEHADAFAGRPERRLELDGPEPGNGPEPAHDLPVPDGDRLAYVIFTSGSTGRPKGVMVSHRAITNRVLWTVETFGLGENDAVLLKTPISFDASLWELFAPLVSGGRLEVARADGHRDNDYLAHALGERRITILQLVPSHMAVLLEQAGLEAAASSLRQGFCGGEALPARTVTRFHERFGAPLGNLYGPTETAIDATSLPRVPPGGEGMVPIGRPLANAGVRLLDRDARPVGIGVPGELHVAGAGLARGYRGQPARTAERFVPDAAAETPGARLYRTGDLALLRPDGTIEFLGRADRQVKVRGFRIEPGEIEAALAAHPGVLEAAVVKRGDDPADERLEAFYAPARPDDVPGEGALREHLSERLPAPMVPAVLHSLDTLPRLPNGKLDRGTLEGFEAPRRRGSGTAPRTATEEVVAAIWSEALGVESVGAHDDFFALGGHSLLAARILARLRSRFRVDVRVQALFETPTVAGLAETLDAAGAYRALDEPLLAPASPAEREGPIPLSSPQRRLWFLQQLEPESPAYNIFGALRMRGALDTAALARAVGEIVRRHEALRVSVRTADGKPYQQIGEPRPPAIPVCDLGALPEPAQEPEVRRLLEREAGRPFDLSRGPLLRLALLRLAEDDRVLSFTLHHVVSDEWSVGVLVRELAALYDAYRRGEPSPLGELPLQYPDYALWQERWLASPAAERQLEHWAERMEGAPEVLPLTTDRTRPAVQSYRGATLRSTLSRELSDALRELSRKRSATLYMTTLAAFLVLLQRYGAGDDLVVGTNVAGRDQAGLEDLIGFFVNAVVLRTDLGGEPTFPELLDRVRETVLDAFAHQELPFDRLVDRLQPRRDMSATPVYQVAFDLVHGGQVPALELPGVELEPFPLGSATAKFDLNLTVEEGAGPISLAVEYSTDLLDETTVRRMLRHLERLLGAAVREDRSTPVRAVPILDPVELRQLTTEAAGPRRSYGLEPTLPERIERTAREMPDAPAAVCDGSWLSYGELARRARRTAALLRRAGVGRGDFVGVLGERDLGFLTHIVAALGCGAAYVPIDALYPDERVLHMLADSTVRGLLTDRRELARRLDAVRACPHLRTVVCADAEAPELAAALAAAGPGGEPGPTLHGPADLAALAGSPEADRPLGAGARPGDPAYMLYTSGSTGKPKGAVVHHAGMLHHVLAELDVLEIDERFVFLQSAPSSSDISVWQFLGPLIGGGRTVIVDPETVSRPSRLWDTLHDQRVTLAELVPAVLQGLVEHAAALSEEARELPLLEWMMATGEAVPVDLVRAWLEIYPDVPVVNAYGPTEASDDVVQATFHRPPDAADRSLSIGRPLPNFTCYVVDDGLRLVPLGVPGELCIGGLGVGQGYWRRPGRTAGVFVPDPFSEGTGDRLYRTGDLVRRLPEGDLEFLGRIDRQVKVRGFRIELEEIEGVLRRHPAVSECAVAVRRQSSGPSLVAYVTESGEPGALDGLRDHARDHLPGHMVPAFFVVLDRLPLTPAGKIDRRALPAPSADGAGRVDAAPYSPPETEVERRMAEIWGEVLQIDRVGADSGFFELGGHSLLATQVVSRIRGAFGVELPLRAVFEHPTLRELAALVEERRGASAGRRAPRMAPVRRAGRSIRKTSDGFATEVDRKPSRNDDSNDRETP